MKSLCTTCKDKVACDAHRRCYGYPNYRVSECIGYEPKDEPQTNAGQHVQHVESVEPIQTDCDTCLYKDTYDEWEGSCDECEDGSEYTPQTERPCDNCQEWDCYGCDYKLTERSE